MARNGYSNNNSNGCSDEDESSYTLIYDIPGASRENIDLKVIPEGIRLIAPRDDETEYFSLRKNLGSVFDSIVHFSVLKFPLGSFGGFGLLWRTKL